MILFQCPYCNGDGSIKPRGIILDAELRIAKCNKCKKEFGVSFVIAPEPDSGYEAR